MKSLIKLLPALAVWTVVALGTGRGFDFTDEGSYYLTALHPGEILDRQTVYFYFGRALFAVLGHNIVFTRCALAALLLGSSLIFTRGLAAFTTAFLPGLKPNPWLAVAAIAGTALAFSTAPVAPSYNLFNAIALLCAVGFALQATSVRPSSQRTMPPGVLLPLLATAALLAVDFSIKFSTAAVVAVALLGLFLLASRETIKSKALLLLAGLGIALLFVAGYFLFVQSFSVWREGIAGTLGALSGGTYVRGEILRYADEFQIQMLTTLWAYEDVTTAVLVTGGFLLLLRPWPVWQRRLAAVGLAVCAGMFAAVAKTEVLRQTGIPSGQFYLGAIVVLSTATGVAWIVRRPAEYTKIGPGAWRLALLLPVLALLPLAGAFGTTNDINANVLYQLAPWLVIIAVLFALLGQIWRASWLSGAGVGVVSAVAVSQFFHGYWRTPYRLPGGRAAQTEATLIGVPASTLRLDPASHAFVDDARQQLAAGGFKPGDDIFAFFNLPGLVFAVGGVSPGHPWYFAGDQNSLIMGAVRVSSVSAARRARAFIVVNGDVESFLPHLKERGLDFPSAYVRCGERLTNPLTHETVEIWRPKNRLPD